MKLGIMQPYFFPYIGYWQLMNAVDRYVIYDDVNYIKQSWINRNNILMNGNAVRINLLLSQASSFKKINEILLVSSPNSLINLLKTIESAYRRAPQFDTVFPMIRGILEHEDKNLGGFLTYSIRTLHAYLGMPSEILLSSDIEKDNNLKGSEKVLELCCILKADTYYNAIGGVELYNRDAFAARGIELRFLKTKPIIYPQFKNEFVPNLSILDVLMFNAKEKIGAMLTQFELL